MFLDEAAFSSNRGSRPADFKELRTGDARPLRLAAREPAGVRSAIHPFSIG